MAQRNNIKQMPAFLPLLALMLLILLDTSAAVPEKKLPRRLFRLRSRHPDGRSPLPQLAGMRTVRRFRGQVSNPGESAGRVNHAVLKPIVRNEENKHRASESVHVVSLPSMNLEGKSQPVYRAAVTKLKIPENDYSLEPKDVSARVLSSQSVLVTWVDPVYEKSAKISSNRRYTIRYREKGESARWDYKDINTRRALVDKLNPDAMYEFSIRISQGDQDGQWSSSIFQRTPESAPTTAPENLYVELINGKNTAVTVTWDELSDSAGKIKEYIISYAPAMKPFGGKSVTYSGTTTSAIIDGLQPGERYIFKVRGANRRGQGPQSKAFTVIMPDVRSVTKNVYQKSHLEDYGKVEKTEEENTDDSVVPLESSEEDVLDSFPKTSFKDPREKLSQRKSGMMPASNRKTTSVGSHQSTEVTDESETTSTPKLSTPVPGRRFRPSINNQFNPNTARRPFRTSSLNLGRRIIARKPISPSVVIGEENETKTSKTEESNTHSTIEDKRSKDSDKVSQETKEAESLNEDYDDVRNTNHKEFTINSNNRETESKSNLPKVQDLGQEGALPSSPSSEILKKERPYINNVGDLNADSVSSENRGTSSTAKLPIEHKTHHMPLESMSGEKKDMREMDKKPKSTSPLQSHRKPTHRFPIAAIPRPQSNQFSSYNTNHQQPDSRLILEKGSEHSTDSHINANKDNQDLHLHDFKTSKEHNLLNTRQQTSARRAFTTTTLPPTSTTTTTIATTTTTTTAEAQTTTKSSKPNKLDKLPSNNSSSVPSFSGKSALELLEYYRRRSSQVNTNAGRKIIPNRNIKIQSVKTTEISTTTVVTTTLPAEPKKSYNQNRLLNIPDKKDDPYLSSSEVPPKHSSYGEFHQEMHVRESKEREPYISKKDDTKTRLVTSKHKTEIHKMPIKKESTGEKSEQMKKLKPKQTESPSVDTLAYSEQSKNSKEKHEEKPEEKKFAPNTRKKSINVLPSSKAETPLRLGSAMPTHHGKPTNTNSRDTSEKSINNAEPLEAPQSHLPSNENVGVEKITVKLNQDPSVLSKDPLSQTDDEAVLDSKRQSFPMSRTVNNSHLKPNPEKNSVESEKKLLKPHMSPSESETSVKAVPAPLPNSGLLTADTGIIQSVPEKQPLPKKEENPTPFIRSRLSSYSNVRLVKNRHNNGNINNSVDSTFSQRQSHREDEELHVPQVGRRTFHRPSRVSSSYMNSRQAIFPRRTSSTVLPTTSQPQSSRVPYRLLPSISRQQNYGRSLFRTTAMPTTTPPRTPSPTYSPSLLRQRMLNSRLGSPLRRQFTRPQYQNGNNGRPNLTSRIGNNGNTPSASRNENVGGQRMIFGPEGTKWVVDLNRGLVLNPEGRYLQDSQGKPLRIKMGGDGRTIVDMNGTPVVSPDGLPLFGHGRFSKPVASAQDKPVLSLGGRPLRGLEVARTTRIPTTRMVTTPIPTTTSTTTLPPTTTTPEPTTVEPTTEELVIPTCAPGSYAQYDEEGNMIVGPDDKPDCYTEDSYSGQDLIVTTETPPERVTYFDLDDDYELIETTQQPIQTTTTTEPPIFYEDSEIKSFDNNLVSEFDAAGKRRFTAPYVSYISKDPNTPCSLTDALEHFQVENLAELIPKEMENSILPPKNISYNITVVAVEGCHSFVILDWAKPKKGDFITGYLVYSASYDDYLKNKWATRTAGGTNLPIENLKPNTRYYFKIQAKNPHGFGPMSPSVTFVTESDNPLLIVRPPGGEPIWIPYAFKHDSSYSGCHGKQYVKRTWYRKFVGVMLCNSLRYKIFLSENLRDTFYSIGDSWGRGEDHCQFVDSYMEGRTDSLSEFLPSIKGYYRQYTQEPVMFGQIGFGTPHNYVGWYECGVPIPGKW
ncbi:fibronectin type III domain-containing protein 1 [Aquarana catesbeiana]|uniref:fibronectin type III domain-containing protein 1 n=1 Tax=Aquarana catesbeiana TaxID=8400 RepID=UPI003CC93636